MYAVISERGVTVAKITEVSAFRLISEECGSFGVGGRYTFNTNMYMEFSGNTFYIWEGYQLQKIKE